MSFQEEEVASKESSPFTTSPGVEIPAIWSRPRVSQPRLGQSDDMAGLRLDLQSKYQFNLSIEPL